MASSMTKGVNLLTPRVGEWVTIKEGFDFVPWWEGVKNGRYPKGIKIGPKVTVWRVEAIRQLIEELQAA